jgi:hypothetical protein
MRVFKRVRSPLPFARQAQTVLSLSPGRETKHAHCNRLLDCEGKGAGMHRPYIEKGSRFVRPGPPQVNQRPNSRPKKLVFAPGLRVRVSMVWGVAGSG